MVMTADRIKLEICCADIESVLAAAAAGADRIELCSALGCGGLTPSAGLIREAVRIMPGCVNVLIRPREGDFLYSAAELRVAREDIARAKALGASGIVFGALDTDGELDTEAVRSMLRAASGMSFTLHRAFDLCSSPVDALEQAADMGIDRILTSGCAPDVTQGREMLRELVETAGGRIIIMAGGGVNADNALQLVGETGVTELHASCKENIPSLMSFRRHGVGMGRPDADEYLRCGSSQARIEQLIEALCHASGPDSDNR